MEKKIVLIDWSGAGSRGINHTIQQTIASFKGLEVREIRCKRKLSGIAISIIRGFFVDETTWFVAPTIAILSYVKSKCRITTIHDLRTYVLKDKKLIHRIYHNLALRATLKYSDKIVCVSEATFTDLQKFFPQYVDKCITIPWSPELNCSQNSNNSKSNFIRKTNPKFLIIGHSENKNPARFARALTNTLTDYEAIVIGATQKFVNEFGNNGKIRTINWLSDSDYMKTLIDANLLVMLSEYEGFGMPVAEALSLGTPCLISEDKALLEIAGTEANVIRIKDEDPVIINKALEVLQKGRLVTKSGRYGERTWEQVASDYENIFLDLISKRNYA